MTHQTIAVDQGQGWQVKACLTCKQQPYQLWRLEAGAWKVFGFYRELPSLLPTK